MAARGPTDGVVQTRNVLDKDNGIDTKTCCGLSPTSYFWLSIILRGRVTVARHHQNTRLPTTRSREPIYNA